MAIGKKRARGATAACTAAELRRLKKAVGLAAAFDLEGFAMQMRNFRLLIGQTRTKVEREEHNAVVRRTFAKIYGDAETCAKDTEKAVVRIVTAARKARG